MNKHVENLEKLVGFLNQDDSESLHIGMYFIECLNSNAQSIGQEDRMRDAVLFIQALCGMKEHLPERSRQACVKGLLEAFRSQIRLDDTRRVAIQILGEYILATRQLALDFPEVMIKGERIESWSQSFAISMFVESKNSQREKLASMLLNADMSSAWLYEVLIFTTPDVWCLPYVHAFILPMLEADEYASIEQLPWMDHGALVLQHEPMVQLYCPMLYPLISIATQEEDWKKKSYVVDMLRVWRAQHRVSGLEIPQEKMEKA